MLKTFDENLLTILKMNALNYAMSACLIQKKRLIIYYLKTFKLTKINYDIKNKKMLTIIITL